MIPFKLSQRPRDPDEVALWWMARKLADPERFAADGGFERWQADPANALAWAEIDRRVESTGAFAAMPEIRAMRADALAHAVAPSNRAPRKVYRLASVLAAASLAALLVFGYATWPEGASAPADAVAAQRYSTAVGGHRDIRLPDGSRVALNTDSTIEVRYSAARRDIRLIAGQALFHVAHNAARPFVVEAGNRLITATGTVFDVRVRADGRMTVLLVQGHVNVDPVRPGGLARIAPQLTREKLDPGERLSADASTGEPVVAVADVDSGTAWNRGVMVLRKDRLGDAVSEINRYSTTQLVIAGPGIADLTISGVFPTDSEDDFIAAVAAFYPVKAVRRAPGTVILTWRSDLSPRS